MTIKAKHAAQIRRGIELYRAMRNIDIPYGYIISVRPVLDKVEDAPELTQRAFDRQLAKEIQ